MLSSARGSPSKSTHRWCNEKKELVIDDFDLDTFNIIVDYMYGAGIPGSVMTSSPLPVPTDGKGRKRGWEVLRSDIFTDTASLYSPGKLGKLLKMSDLLMMVDLKGEVAELMIKSLNDNNGLTPRRKVQLYGRLADQLNYEKLLLACARFMCRHPTLKARFADLDRWVAFTKQSPKFAAALLVAYGELK